MRSPGVRFPPPFIFVLGFLAGLALERWAVRLPLGARVVLVPLGWALALAAFALGAWALVTFFRARTAVVPHRPATLLVRHGPYRFTRNPMYVALTVLYSALAFVFDVAWPLVLLPAVLGLLWQLVIRHEERYLRIAFGDDYASFVREVRRWL